MDLKLEDVIKLCKVVVSISGFSLKVYKPQSVKNKLNWKRVVGLKKFCVFEGSSL